MRIGSHDTDERVVMVADLDEAAGGDATKAIELIEAAAAAGADAVALSAVVPERRWAADQTRAIEAEGRRRLGPEDVRGPAARAAELGLAVVLSVSDRDTLHQLAHLASGWRIEAADADFGVLLDAAGACGMPVLLEVAHPDEVRLGAIVARIRAAAEAGEPLARTAERTPDASRSTAAGGVAITVAPAPGSAAAGDVIGGAIGDATDTTDGGESSHVVVMHAPTAGGRDEDQALPEMLLLATFGDAAGYLDRTADPHDATAAVAAAALGADVIVRPVDAATGGAEAFGRSVAAVRRVEAMLAVGAMGDGSGEVAGDDAAAGDGAAGEPARDMGRVIVTRRDLAVGDLVGFEDIDWRRSDRGRTFGDEPLVVGRRVAVDLPAGTPIDEDVLAPRAGR